MKLDGAHEAPFSWVRCPRNAWKRPSILFTRSWGNTRVPHRIASPSVDAVPYRGTNMEAAWLHIGDQWRSMEINVPCPSSTLPRPTGRCHLARLVFSLRRCARPGFERCRPRWLVSVGGPGSGEGNGGRGGGGTRDGAGGSLWPGMEASAPNGSTCAPPGNGAPATSTGDGGAGLPTITWADPPPPQATMTAIPTLGE